jgi:hypothetical protein
MTQPRPNCCALSQSTAARDIGNAVVLRDRPRPAQRQVDVRAETSGRIIGAAAQGAFKPDSFVPTDPGTRQAARGARSAEAESASLRWRGLPRLRRGWPRRRSTTAAFKPSAAMLDTRVAGTRAMSAGKAAAAGRRPPMRRALIQSAEGAAAAAARETDPVLEIAALPAGLLESGGTPPNWAVRMQPGALSADHPAGPDCWSALSPRPRSNGSNGRRCACNADIGAEVLAW